MKAFERRWGRGEGPGPRLGATTTLSSSNAIRSYLASPELLPS